MNSAKAFTGTGTLYVDETPVATVTDMRVFPKRTPLKVLLPQGRTLASPDVTEAEIRELTKALAQ